jgi:hypothetical protein
MYERNLTIFFNDGNKLTFKAPVQVTQTHSIESYVDNLLSSGCLMVEADESVMVFPLSSIKYFQVWPVPQTLPASVIRGAAIVD